MADVHTVAPDEGPSRTMVRAAWGLLMIWTGAALLLHWGWGTGLVGAGVIMLGAQAARLYLRLRLDGLGLVAGALLVICGAGSLLGVAVDLVPVLCIVAGIALLASIWTARSREASSGLADGHASSHPRA